MSDVRVFGCMALVACLVVASALSVTASDSKNCDDVINGLLEEFELPDEVGELISEILDECPGWVPADPFCVIQDIDGNCIPGVATNPVYTHAHASFMVIENEDDCTIFDVDVHVRAKLPFEYDWELRLNGVPEDGTDNGPFLREHRDTGEWIGEVLQHGESISGSASVKNVDFPGDFAYAYGSYTCGGGALQLLTELLP